MKLLHLNAILSSVVCSFLACTAAEIPANYYLSINFHGALVDQTIQTRSVTWPVDSTNHTVAEITSPPSGSRRRTVDPLVGMMVSSGESKNEGVLISCSFYGDNGDSIFVTNKDVQPGQWEGFLVGPSAELQQGFLAGIPSKITHGFCTLQE